MFTERVVELTETTAPTDEASVGSAVLSQFKTCAHLIGISMNAVLLVTINMFYSLTEHSQLLSCSLCRMMIIDAKYNYDYLYI